MMPEPIESLNEKILQINSLIKELEPEFQRKPPRGDRERIRFPWGTIQTASAYRRYFPFIIDGLLNSNIAFILQLTDVLNWIINWFDIKGVAKDMMIKNAVLLFTCVMEGMAYDFVKYCVPEQVNKNYNKNLKKLLKFEIINQDQYADFEKCRCMRNDIHLHRLNIPELDKYTLIDYNFALRCVIKMRDIFTAYYQSNFLNKKGRNLYHPLQFPKP